MWHLMIQCYGINNLLKDNIKTFYFDIMTMAAPKGYITTNIF